MGVKIWFLSKQCYGLDKPAANRCESLFGNIDFSTRLNESMAIKAGKKFIKIQAGGKTNESFIQ